MIKDLHKIISFQKQGGIEVGENVVIDGPISNKNQKLHIISHAHTDHATHSQIVESMGFSGSEILMTPATFDLMEYTSLNLRNNYRFKTQDYNKTETYKNANDVKVQFLDANHMLGSTQVKIIDPKLDYSIGYSSDIGRNVEKPIDVDILVLDATYITFEDRKRYAKEDSFDVLANKMLEYINQGIGVNIVAHSGLLQSTLHNLGIRRNIFGFDIWEKFPQVICGGQTKQQGDKIKHFCKVYEEWSFKQPEVLNIKDEREDTWHLQKGDSRIAIFSNLEDIQGNYLPTFICEYNPSNNQHPLTKSKKLKDGYHIALSEHDTGNSIDEYIKKVNPKLVITDSVRANPTKRADDFAHLIQNKLNIDAIPSSILMKYDSFI